MALVKVELNGKRIITVDSRTILEVAREVGIDGIPTLCHDEQLEPFTSCFLCVVKVKGARTLLPACSTKVTDGMVVETNTPEVRQSRKAALELLLSGHYADCVGPCQDACPAGVDIQGYLALAALGQFTEAIKLIKNRNPLPAICGRVCTRPCEVNGCRRNLLDEPVGIDYIKRYIADLDLGMAHPFRPEVAAATGKRIAIVGAGPGGLACAYYLAARGHAVQLFEAQPEAGGMLRYGIPEYRLPKEVLDQEIGQILDLGVKLSTHIHLGKDFTVSSLKNQGFDVVFLALGAWESSTMRVKNENVAGVIPGIELLKNVGLRRPPELSGKVLVIGGGNTAIDCARTALRTGAQEVTILYRRTRKEMPANALEIEEAEREGVKIEFLVAPTQVISRDDHLVALECQRMELGAPDSSGRRSPKPVAGSEYRIPCDFVLAAIGQSTTMGQLVGAKVANFLPVGETLKLTRWETVQVDSGTFETSVEGVFAGGDVVTGAATVVEAVAAGRKAAYAIDRYLATGKAEAEPTPFISQKGVFKKVTAEELKSQERIPHRHMPLLSAADRKASFAEVELGYGPDDVSKESARCLECGCGALFDCDLRRLASEYQVDIKPLLGEVKQYPVDRSHPLIELDPNRCIVCGRCVRMCSDVVGVAAYGFVNRGFATTVRPALGGSLLETECTSCGLCIGTCPTGAILPVLPLSKPGPWATTAVTSTCHYCGVGCELELRAHGDTFVTPARVERGRTTLGNHCRKGLFAFDYVQAPDRLLEARVRSGRELGKTTLDDAIQYTGMRLRELAGRVRPEEIAVFLSPRLTNEEIFLAQKLARVGLRTHQVTSFTHLLNPEIQHPEVVSTGTYRDLLGAQAVLVVGSELDEEHFAVDLLLKRAVRGGARLVVVGQQENRTTQVAEAFVRCPPGSEPDVLLAIGSQLKELAPNASVDSAAKQRVASGVASVDAAEIEAAARILAESVARVLVFNKDWRGERAPQDETSYASFARSLGMPLLALREKSNAQGLLDMGAVPEWFPGYQPIDDPAAIQMLEKEWGAVLRDLPRPRPDIAAALAAKQIKVALVLGEDPLGNPALPAALRGGLEALEFLMVGDLFMTPTAEAAHVVLPLSSPVETDGTLTNHERRLQPVRASIPPRNGLPNWQIFCQLGARLGQRFRMKYDSVGEVLDEIRRVVPIYRGVMLNGSNEEAVWDLAQFPLRPSQSAPGTGTLPGRPRDTLAFDYLERRWQHRYRQLMERAQKALAATAG
jgi:formate dehydrogenase major subunit